jgi:uncharacterized membrane protein (UPF0127 family)
MTGAAVFSAWASGCTPTTPNELDKLGTLSLTIKGQAFQLWIADEYDEQTRGLMFVTAGQLSSLPDGTRRGMLFAFDREQRLNFWMKNTIIPLDIAYATTDGRVTAIHSMAPLDDRYGQYPSGEPARFAIEVNAGVWREIGLVSGDRIEIPGSVLKRNP